MARNIQNRDDWIVIGVSGVTCGGKTTLANQLKGILTPVHIFHQDKYFYPDDSPKHVKCQGMPHNNYDILSSLDMEKMYEDVVQTICGVNMSAQSSEERREGQIEVKGKKFLIIEGFTVLNYEPIVEICDLRYYFILEYGECAARRCHRVYDPPDIEGYFEKCVWPEHVKYRAEIEKDKRIVLLEGTRADSLDVVLGDLRARDATHVTLH